MFSEVREGVGHAVIQSASGPSLALTLTYFLFFIPNSANTTPFFLFLHILTLLSFIHSTRLSLLVLRYNSCIFDRTNQNVRRRSPLAL